METDWEASLLSLALARALYDALTPLEEVTAQFLLLLFLQTI